MAIEFTRSVERMIPAPASEIFALVADPARHPEIDGSGMVISLKVSDTPLRLGSSFEMAMKRGARYVMRSTIIDFEPDRVVAWQTRPTLTWLGKLIGGRIWRYDLTPVDGGTIVKETWDVTQEHNRHIVVRDAPQAVRSMTRTLERIEQLLS